MRDIRNDLKQRARLIEEQIAGAYAQFEQMLEQLQTERDGRVSELKAELAALGKLMEAEHRRMANEGQLVAAPVQQPQLSLADFIMRKLNEIGPLSKDDLVNLTLQEGIFADPESADHAVHSTLVTVIRNEYIRQLHDGTFVPNTLPQALRMRRAV